MGKRGARAVAVLLGGLGALFGGGANGCQLVVDDKPGAGIGASCSKDEQCQASKCVGGVCTTECSASEDCPAPSLCAAGMCQLPMNAGFVYAFDPGQQQWTAAQEAGRDYASKALKYLGTEFVQAKYPWPEASGPIDEMIARGRKVIVTDEATYGEQIQQKAAQNPGVAFLTCGARPVGENFGSYYGRIYQAYYLAGFAAGSKTTTGRVGILGSYVTPNVVAAINAYATGAKRAKVDVVVEVRWVEFWHALKPAPPPGTETLERVLTKQLIASGCDPIADMTDSQIVISTIADVGGAQSIGYNTFDLCEANPTCLGAVTWNWGPLFRTMFNDIHQAGIPANARYDASIQADSSASVVNFRIKGGPLETELAKIVEEMVPNEGWRRPFQGELCSTGQRADCIPEGQTVSEEELHNMCWFAEGIVERQDPEDPLSDIAALVPNDGDCKTPEM